MPTTRPGRPTEGETGSDAERERHRRIVESTIALATEGGFETVQMRMVAERAEVALGTLYRYFPSKVHLLVTALVTRLEHEADRLGRITLPADTRTERVLFTLHRITTAMRRDRLLTEAMTRAFMVADTSVTTEVNQATMLIETLLTRAMALDEPTADERAVVGVIGDVWLSTLAALVTGRAPASDLTSRLELTVRLLLR